MASTLNAAACAAAAMLLWTAVGLAVARRLVPVTLALPMAPAIGWAVHSSVALPVFFLVPFSAINVAAAAVVTVLVGTAAARAAGPPDRVASVPRVPAAACAAAAVLAMVPAAAIVPKHVGDAVALAAPIFDHAKVALINDMVRLGLPPGNPFFGHDGGSGRFAYYYLWHFSAAELARVLGVSGWEADAAMTWFSAFSSLAAMMALATWCSGRAAAAFWVVVLAAAASCRFVLWRLLGSQTLDALLPPPGGFGGWLFQSAWVPQHVASATCLLLAIYLISRLAGCTGAHSAAIEAVRERSEIECAPDFLRLPHVLCRTGGHFGGKGSGALPVIALALVVAAGFESSTWIGGVVFAVVAPVVAVVLVVGADPARRWRLVASLAVAGVLAAALCAPFLHDQIVAATLRGGGSPVAFHPVEVLGDYFPRSLRRILDLPAFWLVLLTVELPAVYVTGSIVLARLLAVRDLDRDRIRFVAAFAGLTGGCLAVSWLMTSTLADNNDLGWRAVLPAGMALTVMSAVGLSRWIAARARLAATAAIGAIVLALPGTVTLIRGNMVGDVRPDGKLFAATPDLWAAVRHYAAADERVANNPLFLGDMTLWPVNISWSLLANRRSCFAGRELTLAYTSLPQGRREEIDARFVRIFAGDGSATDIRELATGYDCRVIVLTTADGAWANDPFAASPLYRLVDGKPGHWRIYRTTAAGEANR